MMPATLVKDLETASGTTKPMRPANATPADSAKYQHDLLAYQRKIVNSNITSILGDFHTSVYQPATDSISKDNVDTFLASRDVSGLRKNDVKELLVSYFVTQPHGAVNASLTSAQTQSANVASSSGYAAVLAGLGQGAAGGGGSTGGGSTGPPGGGTGGGTTGGSSMFLTSNSGKNKGNIWGPAYTGMGDNAGSGMGGGVRDYPTLLGPKPKESTMVEGGGISKPSQHQTLATSGVLPGASQTGSDPDSQYFGSSRVPGDKDLFPNPYQEFTPSIGSSKTEPVPFLSDFSAFFR
jgi:hypothetical protein